MREAISTLGFTPRQRNVHYELFDQEHESKAVQANLLWMKQKQDAGNGAVYQLA
jgi:cyclic dehypoxanthinyl futalosine synthase